MSNVLKVCDVLVGVLPVVIISAIRHSVASS